MSRPYYITTAIHYVNDLPHIGHMYENVVADAVARYRRAAGDDVFFLTGTDEHGQKIERAAAKRGIAPIELADEVVRDHKDLWSKLGVTHDDFIRTTEPRHHRGVYELIRRIRERNPEDIYEGEHAGWYCQNEETFVPESQVKDRKCEEGHPVEWTTEKNYFFRLSKYTEPLLEYYRANPGFVKPATRFNEVISFVETGLRDLSVSRTSIRWGIPFPDAPGHVIYVWMDALTNYISALGFGSDDDTRFQRYWPGHHLIGKDIVRFHAVYWPAFLMAAGLELPREIVAHGWWLRNEQKISKSLGNVVRPTDMIERFGPDAFRYFVMRVMPFGQDADYSDEDFLARYNSDLANDLGNTLARTLRMCDNYFAGKTPPVPCDDNEILRAAADAVPDYLAAMDAWQFQRAIEIAWKLLVAINGYIVNREPWKMHKQNGANDSLSRVLWNTLEGQRIVWTMLAPIMPHCAADALRRIGSDPEAVGHDRLRWGLLPNGTPVTPGESLFPRADVEALIGSISKPTGGTVSETTQPQEPAKSEQPAEVAAQPPAQAEAGPARVSIDRFFEIDLRVAQIMAATRIPKSKKLMELRVSTGDSERTLVAGIAAKYSPEELVGRKVVIVANLEPAKLMGVESNGMVLAASIDGEPSLLAVDPSVPAGTKVK